MKKFDMNLLERYLEDQKAVIKQGTSIRVFVIILISLILVLGAFIGKIILDNMMYQRKIDELNSFMSLQSTQDKIANINKIETRLSLLDKIETEATGLSDVMAYIPLIDSYAMDIVDEQKPDTVSITNYNYADNTLTIELSTKYSSDFSNYVLHLLNTHFFESVNNYSYSYDETAGRYNGSLVCVLKGGQ